MSRKGSAKPKVSRRGVLLGTGAVVAAGSAAWAVAPAVADDAAAGGRFNLKNGALRYIRERTLKDVTVLQSFDFDYVHGHIYVVQVKSGGRDEGHLTLTKLDLSGQQMSHMYLHGFGHGVNIGVEPVGDDTYIWTETDSNPDSGYGRAITRFTFRDEATLTYGSSDIPVYRPVSGSTSNTPALDLLNKRIGVRYRQSGSVYYRVFDLEEFKSGTFDPVASFEQVGVDDEVFQGWALRGDYVYQMTGTAYTDENGDNPPSDRGNCYLTCIDIRTGELVQRAWTQAAYSLDYREPEGMGVMPTSPPRLYLGYASGDVGSRKLTLYYKPQ